MQLATISFVIIFPSPISNHILLRLLLFLLFTIFAASFSLLPKMLFLLLISNEDFCFQVPFISCWSSCGFMRSEVEQWPDYLEEHTVPILRVTETGRHCLPPICYTAQKPKRRPSIHQQSPPKAGNL